MRLSRYPSRPAGVQGGKVSVIQGQAVATLVGRLDQVRGLQGTAHPGHRDLHGAFRGLPRRPSPSAEW